MRGMVIYAAMVLSPHFTLVFYSKLFLTVFLFIVYLSLVVYDVHVFLFYCIVEFLRQEVCPECFRDKLFLYIFFASWVLSTLFLPVNNFP